MSREPQAITVPEPAEPTAESAPVPVWVFVVLFIALYWGMLYFDRRAAWFNPQVYTPYKSLAQLQTFQPPSDGPNLDRGRAVYENICALCHNNDGTGKPNQAPTFVGSEWVTGSHARLIRIPLYGLAGPLQVKGEAWNLAMPAVGASLSDDDLAAVLTYMRQSWGNKAPVVTAEHVKAVRTQVGNRPQPWSAEELNAIQ